MKKESTFNYIGFYDHKLVISTLNNKGTTSSRTWTEHSVLNSSFLLLLQNVLFWSSVDKFSTWVIKQINVQKIHKTVDILVLWFLLAGKSIHDPVCACVFVSYLSPVLGQDLSCSFRIYKGSLVRKYYYSSFLPSPILCLAPVSSLFKLRIGASIGQHVCLDYLSSN